MGDRAEPDVARSGPLRESEPQPPSATAAAQAPDEHRALARFAFVQLEEAIGGVAAVHKAVSRRVFGRVGGADQAVRPAHDAIAGSSYEVVRHTSGLVGAAIDVALRWRRRTNERPLSQTPGASAAIGVLHGLRGDALAESGSDLHQPMSVRIGTRPVALERSALAAAFPDATPRLAVFIHGVMQTESSWRRGGAREEETYGAHLRRDLDYTPIFVRYNSGLHISQNGLALGELLEALCVAWPVEVEQIALVGHSMGGLVARSACHQASGQPQHWVHLVRHVISLGSPHAGAPLEQFVHLLASGLHSVPETRPLSSFLRRRSAGIRDLRTGSLVEQDWRDRDPDALWAEACREVPLLEGAMHCFIAATLTRSPRHPLGHLVGDLLVRPSSAAGHSRTRRIPFHAGAHVGGLHHRALLNDPAVYECLREWLATPAAGRLSGRGAAALPRRAGRRRSRRR